MPIYLNQKYIYASKMLRRYLKLYEPERILDVIVGTGGHVAEFKALTKSALWFGVKGPEELEAKYDHLFEADPLEAIKECLRLQLTFDVIFLNNYGSQPDTEKLISGCKALCSKEGIIILSDENAMLPDNKNGLISLDSDITNAMTRPLISVYAICKNEESFINRFVDSCLAEPIHSLVILDTGSTDSTVKKLDAYTDKRLKIHEAHVSPWRFDDARNMALAFVDPSVDLCISADIDEVIASGSVSKLTQDWQAALWRGDQLPTRWYHNFKTVWDWTGEGKNISAHFHERIHDRFGYRWIHPVHEKLVSQTELIGWAHGFSMIQYPDTAKDRTSYLPLLKQAVKEDPNDWKLMSFLAGELRAAGDVQGALTALDDCKKLPNADLIFLGWSKAALLSDKQDKKEELKRVIKLAPNLREAHLALADFYRDNNEPSKELEALISACDCKDETYGYHRRQDAWDLTPEHRLGALRTKL